MTYGYWLSFRVFHGNIAFSAFDCVAHFSKGEITLPLAWRDTRSPASSSPQTLRVLGSRTGISALCDHEPSSIRRRPRLRAIVGSPYLALLLPLAPFCCQPAVMLFGCPLHTYDQCVINASVWRIIHYLEKPLFPSNCTPTSAGNVCAKLVAVWSPGCLIMRCSKWSSPSLVDRFQKEFISFSGQCATAHTGHPAMCKACKNIRFVEFKGFLNCRNASSLKHNTNHAVKGLAFLAGDLWASEP